jgi:hypothetical protein
MHPTRLVRALAVAAALLPASTTCAADASAGTRETPIVVRLDDAGFQWTDAAIGAVAGVSATLVTIGGVALVRLQRPSLRTKGGRP